MRKHHTSPLVALIALTFFGPIAIASVPTPAMPLPPEAFSPVVIPGREDAQVPTLVDVRLTGLARTKPALQQLVARAHVELRSPVQVTKPVSPAHASNPASTTDGARIGKAYARSQLDPAQYACIEALWARESGWRWNALNSSSGAYGIPQALPGSKMQRAGPDWATNPVTQVQWGLSYVIGRYGSSCDAWAFFRAHGWY